MELGIEPLRRSLDVQPGTNLLTALREADVPISYSCMAGRCGVCRCKLIEGQVLLSASDLRQPIVSGQMEILACQTTLTSPCRIELPEPDEVIMHPARVLKGDVALIQQETHDIKKIVVKTNKKLEFSPGQYATLQFTPEHSRPYSMAGIEDDDQLAFYIRLIPGGHVSSYVFETLKVGDKVRVSGPLGTSYLRRKHQGPMLCICGGSGLAPVLSIIRGALAAGMKNDMYIYFGVRSAQDIYATDILNELVRSHPWVRIHTVVSHGPAPAGARQGLVTEAVMEDFKTLTGFRAYLCGPPVMVEAASLLVKGRGIEAEHIYADAFYPTQL